MYLCKQVGLTNADLEHMTYAMCLDYIDEYIEQKNPTKTKVKQATQSDFDNF